MLGNQTMKPHKILVYDEKPLNKSVVDITYRYRKGYEKLSSEGYDVILFMENDDWYAETYIETMVSKWLKNGKPDIFGTDYTIYYNLHLNAWFTMHHKRRSSAMSTLIKPNLSIEWCRDDYPFTDLHLWTKCGLSAVTFHPEKHICLGIKHGTGLCGGRHHTTRLHHYTNTNAINFLKQTLDQESFNFYTNYATKST
jgi:hypothetical protein